MAELPKYLEDQTEEQIRSRMLANVDEDLDRAEGSYIYDAVSPSAIEFARAVIWAQQVLDRGFAQTTFGQYLDYRAGEHGVTRLTAEKATGTVKFSGKENTTIPQATRVATPSDSANNEPSIEFETLSDVTIDSTLSAYVQAEAVEAGAEGNIPSGAISILVDAVNGVTSVTNESSFTDGVDEETDKALLERYLQRKRNPSASGNDSDYINWSLEVTGVGGVTVIPAENGGSTVGVYVIDNDKQPAPLALVQDVQYYIAPPYEVIEEDSQFSVSGGGVTTDTTIANTSDGSTLKMVYDSTANGVLTLANAETLLVDEEGADKPGIWHFRPRIIVDSQTETTDLVEVGVWNNSTSSWAKTDMSGNTDAVKIYSASELRTSYDDIDDAYLATDSKHWGIDVEFYYNLGDQLDLRVTRLSTDTATTLWIDNAVLLSSFSKHIGEAKAPIGAVVSVDSAEAITINVDVNVTIESGYDQSSVESAIKQNLKTYIRGIAFEENNNVKYSEIGRRIIETEGVLDYSNLLVNGNTNNVSVSEKQVAILGVVTLT